jgi:hypothetical protein
MCRRRGGSASFVNSELIKLEQRERGLTDSNNKDGKHSIDLVEIKPSPPTAQRPKLPIRLQQLPHPPPELHQAQGTKDTSCDSENCVLGKRGAVPEAVDEGDGEEAGICHDNGPGEGDAAFVVRRGVGKRGEGFGRSGCVDCCGGGVGGDGDGGEPERLCHCELS